MKDVQRYVKILKQITEVTSVVNDKIFCLCPFHEEKVGSFVFYINTRTYHCFGCNAHGNLRKLLNPKKTDVGTDEWEEYFEELKFLSKPAREDEGDLLISITFNFINRVRKKLLKGDITFQEAEEIYLKLERFQRRKKEAREFLAFISKQLAVLEKKESKQNEDSI